MTTKDKVSQHIEILRKRAEKSHLNFQKKHPHISKKLVELGLQFHELRRHSAKKISAAALAGTMLISSPTVSTSLKPPAHQINVSEGEAQEKLKQELVPLLPKQVKPLSPQLESEISEVIYKNLGLKAVANLEGNHLNQTYGRMGGEQHLPRYPGDRVSEHDALQSKGITPGKGAWGYFVSRKSALTQEDYLREKYYVAVQTLYLPNWKKDLAYLRDWYKYRKVLVVNPSNGKSVVAVIADAGPAAWTTKHFGGSPEVMDHLTPFANGNNGKVILFFVDDQEKPVALGPVPMASSAFIARK